MAPERIWSIHTIQKIRNDNNIASNLGIGQPDELGVVEGGRFGLDYTSVGGAVWLSGYS